jgi:Zn finger protein HypA/HybF involved in hydrogenase expression
MPAVCLRLRTTCSTCGHPVPLTSAKRPLSPCPSCDAPVSLGAAAFLWAMRPGVDARSPEEGASLLGEVSPARVACRACGATVGDDAIERGIAVGSLACPAGHAIAVRAVPPEMGRAPWWSVFLGESDRDQVAPSEQPVQFSCANCGGALLADGTTRTPPCRFCGTRAYLPEDLWRTLRPTPRVEPFYLWIDPASFDRWTRARKAAIRWAVWSFMAVWPGVGFGLLAMAYSSGVPSTSESGLWEAVSAWGCAGWLPAWVVAYIVHAKRSPT